MRVNHAPRSASNPVTFHVNQSTGLVVLQDSSGSFLSGWKLNGQQLHHAINDGKI
ncbi:colicin D domain-containing protein [Rhodovulum sulfidophilum]